MCASDEAIVGLAGRLDSRGWHGRIQAQCAKVAATPTPPYGIVTGAPRTTPLRGLLGSVMWTRSCPTNEVLVGFNGRAGALIDSMTFRCAPVNINLVAGSYQVVIGTATSLPAIGGSGGNAFPTSDCPPGQVATTIRGRAGDNVDAFGLRCSTVNPN